MLEMIKYSSKIHSLTRKFSEPTKHFNENLKYVKVLISFSISYPPCCRLTAHVTNHDCIVNLGLTSI